MFNKIKVEYRLAVLEEEVTDLKQEIVDLKQAAFLEALDYGRSVRQADQPLDDIEEAG
jgi:hypothetical protein